jgi:hypothetical protein
VASLVTTVNYPKFSHSILLGSGAPGQTGVATLSFDSVNRSSGLYGPVFLNSL